METKEYTGCRNGTSKQHAPPRKSKTNPKTREKKNKIILHPYITIYRGHDLGVVLLLVKEMVRGILTSWTFWFR